VAYCAEGTTDYSKQDGWSGVCTTGNEQSPIDIQQADKERHYGWGLDMPTLHVKHVKKASTVYFDVEQNGENIVKMHNEWPVGHTKGLQLLQVHVHWGEGAHSGSEHHLYGQTYSSEMHLVTRNLDQPEEGKPDYYAVFGIFLDEDRVSKDESRIDTELDNLLLNMFDSDKADDLKTIDFSMLYHNYVKSIMTYEGSLTTPGCNEMVFWQVFSEPIPVKPSTAQLLRDFAHNGGVVGKTNRDLQPLNGRQITARYLNEKSNSVEKDCQDGQYKKRYENGDYSCMWHSSGATQPLSAGLLLSAVVCYFL